MSTIIEEEQESAGKYMLETIEGYELAALTLDNVARVEAMINTNSRYKALWRSNIENKGYSPYWIREMGRHLGYSELGEKKEPGKNFEGVVRNVVEKIDNENSTHLNADRGLKKNDTTGRDWMVKQICENKKLLDCLKDKGLE